MQFTSKKYIFKYNSNDELQEYFEKREDGKTNCAYSYKGNVLKKVYYNLKEEEEFYNETKTVSIFPENSIMFHHFFDGISRVYVSKKDCNYTAPLKSIEKRDNLFTRYTVKQDLLKKWIQELSQPNI